MNDIVNGMPEFYATIWGMIGVAAFFFFAGMVFFCASLSLYQKAWKTIAHELTDEDYDKITLRTLKAAEKIRDRIWRERKLDINPPGWGKTPPPPPPPPRYPHGKGSY